MLQFRCVAFAIWDDVTISVARSAPKTMSILGAYFANVHVGLGRTWGDVGLNNRERMLWGDIWCCCGWGTVVVIIVIKVISVSIEDIIQWVIVVWRWIIGCVNGMGVGGGRGCDRV